MWYAYVSPTTRRSFVERDRFLASADLSSARGFRSVYLYDQRTVDLICTRRNFRDLRTVHVRSEELLLDFDSNPRQGLKFLRSLLREDIGFELYTSGNRSLHFHVSIVPMEGAKVSRSQKEWVKRHAPGADTTIYHNAALYRLPWTWHEKNPGHRKQLQYKHEGKYLLDIPEFTAPVYTVSQVQAKASPARLKLALSDKVTEGGRRVHLWRIGTLCYDNGLDLSEAISYGYKWGTENCVPPLDPETIARKITEAYEQRSYGG